MELLTVNSVMSNFIKVNLNEPKILLKELKKVVRELRQRNPHLGDYCLMDVGFTTGRKNDTSQIRLYFTKKSH